MSWIVPGIGFSALGALNTRPEGGGLLPLFVRTCTLPASIGSMPYESWEEMSRNCWLVTWTGCQKLSLGLLAASRLLTTIE